MICSYLWFLFFFLEHSVIECYTVLEKSISSCVSKLITYDDEKILAKVVMKWVAQFTSKTFSYPLVGLCERIIIWRVFGVHAHTHTHTKCRVNSQNSWYRKLQLPLGNWKWRTHALLHYLLKSYIMWRNSLLLRLTYYHR